MTAYAERYFYLAEPDTGGRTKRDRLLAKLERAERKNNPERIAEIEADLIVPPFPRALAYIWRAYLRLRRRSAPGFNGAVPIGWQDIDAFIRRAGLRFAPWEIELLEALDDIYLRPEPTPTPPEGQAVTTVASPRDGAGVKSVMGSVGRRRIVKRKGG